MSNRLVIATLCLACAVQGADAPFAWKSVNLQGMGYVTGLVIHPKAPNDIYIRTDVGGAYRYDRGGHRWLALADRADIRSAGFEAIAVDPTDPNTVYGSAGVTSGSNTYAEVFVSHSRGAYWQPTGLAAAKLYIGANDPYRGTTGEKLCVDPTRPQRIFLGTRKDGLWVKDGERDWTRISAIPSSPTDSSGNAIGVAFVVADGANNRIYAGVWGSGVWMSQDGGVTWTNVAQQLNPARAVVASDGTLIETLGMGEGGQSGGVRRYRAGTWKDITPMGNSDSFAGVTVSTANPKEVVVCAGHDQLIYRSMDQGDTWAKVVIGGANNQSPYYRTGPEANNSARSAGWGNGTVTLDPLQPKRLLQTNGYGVIVTEDYTAATTMWQWWMNNLEELVVQSVRVPPLAGGADLISAGMDMVGFRHASRDAAPLATAAQFDWVAQGNSIAYSAQHPESVAMVGWDEANVSHAMTAYSSDNGQTWTPFASTSPGVGGNIAMSSTDPQNMVWVPTRNATPNYTTDGGRSWKPCRLGSGNLPASWQVSNEWWAPQIVAADPVTGSKFYFYEQGNVYVSTDGGATWTRTATIPGVTYTVKVTLVPNPAKGDELWIAHRHNDNQPPFPLYRSTDGGKTFSTVPGVDAGSFIAFGKGNAPDTPFLYLYGQAAGQEEAMYKSEDMGATWQKINDNTQEAFGSISALEGDMRTKDLVYVGMGGRGLLYGYGPVSGIAAPSLRTEDVKNGAGYQVGGVAPGEIVTFWGSGIGPESAAAAQLDEAGFISTSTGGTQVFFDGFPAPMIYSKSGQSSAVAPYALAGRTTTQMQVAYNGALSPPVALPVEAAMPAIFTLDATGKGAAVVVNNSNGQLNSASNPAKRGEYILFYVTGDGQTSPGGLDGWPVSGTPPRTVQQVNAAVGGVPAHVDYAGSAPNFVMGVAQFNVEIPADAPSGPAVALAVNVGGVDSPSGVTIAIE